MTVPESWTVQKPPPLLEKGTASNQPEQDLLRFSTTTPKEHLQQGRSVLLHNKPWVQNLNKSFL